MRGAAAPSSVARARGGSVGYRPHRRRTLLSQRSVFTDRANLGRATLGMSRGWLMRRLLAVDLVGLTTAFLLALVIAPPAASDRVGEPWELVLFVMSLRSGSFSLACTRCTTETVSEAITDRGRHRRRFPCRNDRDVVVLGRDTPRRASANGPSARRVLADCTGGRSLLRAAIRVVGRRQAAYVQDVIIVGSGQVARLLSKIKQHPEYHLRVLGFVDRDGGASLNGAGRLQLIGDTDDLPGLVRSYGADRVVITFSSESDEQTLDVIRRLQDTNVQIDIVPRMFEILGTNARLHTIEGLPLVGLPVPRLSAPPDCSQALTDLAGGVGGLILLGPLFLLIAAWIRLDSHGPVFFRQVRMGAGDRTFRVFKFRTMVNDAETRKSEVAHLNMHRNGDSRMFRSRTTHVSLVSAGFFGGREWMSFHSSSTSSEGRCRSWAPGR